MEIVIENGDQSVSILGAVPDLAPGFCPGPVEGIAMIDSTVLLLLPISDTALSLFSPLFWTSFYSRGR